MSFSLMLASLLAAGQNPVSLHGVCDASAGWMVDGKLLVINDEDQERTFLRLYDPGKDGLPTSAAPFDASRLNLETKREEMDLEALARVGDRYFVIGSHSRNKDGKKRISRQRLFAFRLPPGGPAGSVSIDGVPYSTLLGDLGRHLKQTIGLNQLDPPLDPKDGGVSIEGLAATPGGELLIGFRSPLHQQKAIVATLSNPLELIQGKPARYGAVLLLDLNGGGIRDFVWSADRKHYLIIAGPVGPGGPFALYKWTGGASASPVRLMDLGPVTPAGASPEALVLDPQARGRALVLFDEGGRLAEGGKECKDLPAGKTSFRGRWVDLPE